MKIIKMFANCNNTTQKMEKLVLWYRKFGSKLTIFNEKKEESITINAVANANTARAIFSKVNR